MTGAVAAEAAGTAGAGAGAASTSGGIAGSACSAAVVGGASGEGTAAGSSMAASRSGRSSRTATTIPSSSRPVAAVTAGRPTRSPSQPCTTRPVAWPPPTPSMNRLAMRARSSRGARTWQTVLVPDSTAR
jgi:hypothetical protein